MVIGGNGPMKIGRCIEACLHQFEHYIKLPVFNCRTIVSKFSLIITFRLTIMDIVDHDRGWSPGRGAG
jgi:hypothetical protein